MGENDFFICDKCQRYSVTWKELRQKLNEEGKEVSCPRCTFLNKAGAEQCEICSFNFDALLVKKFDGSSENDTRQSCDTCLSDFRCNAFESDDPSVHEMPGRCCSKMGCTNCWRKWIREKASEQRDTVPSLCGCNNNVVDLGFIESIMGKTKAVQKMLKRAVKNTIRRSNHDEADLIECPYPDCSNCTEVDKEYRLAEIRCVGCEGWICVLCKRPAHDSNTCPPIGTIRLPNGTKQCPNCGEGVFKAKGDCNKVICSKCNHLFCFKCLREPDKEGRLPCSCTSDDHQFANNKGEAYSIEEVKALVRKNNKRRRSDRRVARYKKYANRNRRSLRGSQSNILPNVPLSVPISVPSVGSTVRIDFDGQTYSAQIWGISMDGGGKVKVKYAGDNSTENISFADWDERLRKM